MVKLTTYISKYGNICKQIRLIFTLYLDTKKIYFFKYLSTYDLIHIIVVKRNVMNDI